MKTVKILTITFLIIFILQGKILAVTTIFDEAKNWISVGQANQTLTMDTSKLKTSSDEIYNILLTIGTSIAVIVGAFLGIKYMTAGIEDKVKVKESLIPYLISCVVLFGTFGIWKLAITILKDFN